MQFVSPNNEAFEYHGRNGKTENGNPLWVFAYAQARFRFTGTSLSVHVRNYWNYGNIRLGVVIDNTQFALRLPSPAEPDVPANCTVEDDGSLTILVADHLPEIEHEAVVFKRQDGGMHYLEFRGVSVDDRSCIQAPAHPVGAGAGPAPTAHGNGTSLTNDLGSASTTVNSSGSAYTRPRMEVYGDSVTCGERNEALLYTGKADPDEDLSAYSNSWYSYAAIAARDFHADVRLISQGGAPLTDGIGWFNAPNYIGMESIWDRVKYNPALGETSTWDFHEFEPQIVLVALGQNDSHPHDFMRFEYDGEQAREWRKNYSAFLEQLHGKYPNAHIICSTTVLEHDPSWDRAIEEVVNDFNNPLVSYLRYSRTGVGTPGHPRIPEDEEMARELCAYIRMLNVEGWN